MLQRRRAQRRRHEHRALSVRHPQHARTGGEILTEASLRAVRQKDELEHAVAVQDGHNTEFEEIEEPADENAYQVSAWFNVDLRKHLSLPDEPGEYVVELRFFDSVSEQIPFKIEFKKDED